MKIALDNYTPWGYNIRKRKIKEEYKMADVVIFSSNTCPYCVAAKEYLDELGIDYLEKNIQTDKAARSELMSMGHMGVPVLLIDGEEVVGFDKPKIYQLLCK